MGVLAVSGGGPAGASSSTTVKAIETEYHIALSKKTFSPGAYTFVAINKGKTTHALEITGSGLHASTADISPARAPSSTSCSRAAANTTSSARSRATRCSA